MTDPAILSIATGVPPRCYTQPEVFDFLQTLFVRTRHARAIFNVSGVDKRHMAADEAFYASNQGTQARNDRYLAAALPLGEATLQRCLFSVEEDGDVDPHLAALHGRHAHAAEANLKDVRAVARARHQPIESCVHGTRFGIVVAGQVFTGKPVPDAAGS